MNAVDVQDPLIISLDAGQEFDGRMDLQVPAVDHILINIRGKLHSVANLIIKLKQLSIRLVFEES